ncbi:MAG: hypothetical protein ACREPU_10710 [Rhodanobacteraceae bacterium]
MADIVFVHGIGQEQQTADTLENVWLPALAGGVRVAGFPQVADRLWRDRGSGSIDARMAFYGALFLRANQQGHDPGDFTEMESAVAEQLAVEWLRHVAARASKRTTMETGQRELAYVSGQMGAEQGAGNVLRSAIASLAKVPWFAPFGMGLAERFVQRSLAQVTRYFTDEAVRAAALEAVSKLIGPETKLVIGHSLGSVIAYEATQRMHHPLPVLITLGSPLGLQTIVYERLRPQPPGYPSAVRRWVNVAARDDFIAAEPDLNELFGTSMPAGAVFEGGYTVDNGVEPHRADFYLGKSEVGTEIGRLYSP